MVDIFSMFSIYLAILIAITVHEFAHAYTADQLGDPTPRLMGRVTLNPFAHLDLIGTLAFLLVGFGWGKPVLFDPFNLKNPRRDSAVISFAGPLSNLILVALSGILITILKGSIDPFAPSAAILRILQDIAIYNTILAVFNLIPVYPLDGFKVVEGLLPTEKAAEWAELRRYGMIFLIVMILPILNGTSLVAKIVMPITNFILQFVL